ITTCGYEPNQLLKATTDLVTAEQVLLESLMLEMFGEELPTWQEDVELYFDELKRKHLVETA
ncbi:MAG: hypothetical protein U0O24_05090, partial [Eggerthellaceae bacterium]